MIEKLTIAAIALLKQLIETQSFSSEEDRTALLIENWFTTHQIKHILKLKQIKNIKMN
jgi:acetylornithine deacetylase